MAAGDRRTIQTPGGFTQIQEQRADGTWLIIKSTKVGSGSGATAVTPPAGIVNEGGRRGAVAGSSGGRGDTSLLATPPPVTPPVAPPVTPPTPAAETGGDSATVAAIQALTQQLSASNEQANRNAANLQALQQAFNNSSIGIQSQQAQTDLLNTTLQSPRANFMSQFLLRGQGQGVPATPGLQALYQRGNIPNTGNIPNGGQAPMQLRPEDYSTQALMQAFQGIPQASVNALAADPVEREVLSGWSGLLGLNPDAFWRLRSPQIPTSASLTPNFLTR